jgi:hypothetical protein
VTTFDRLAHDDRRQRRAWQRASFTGAPGGEYVLPLKYDRETGEILIQLGPAFELVSNALSLALADNSLEIRNVPPDSIGVRVKRALESGLTVLDDPFGGLAILLDNDGSSGIIFSLSEDGLAAAVSPVEQFNAYLTTDLLTVGGSPFTIPINTADVNTDPANYTLAAGVVGLALAGRYEHDIDVTVARETGGSSFRADVWIAVNGTEYPGTRRSVGASA